WTNVTSFTVSASELAAFTFDNLSVAGNNSSTIFGWETAVDVNDEHKLVTETVDGITVTFENGDGTPSSTVIATGTRVGTSSANSAIFTFDQSVDVNSIVVSDASSRSDRELTFTPIIGGGTNAPVVVTLVEGAVPGGGTLYLNWTDVTAFRVEVTASPLTLTLDYLFDDLSVNPRRLAVTDDYAFQKAQVYPNPVEDMLYVKHVSDLKLIKVYNHLGQQV
ncbi:hypothetical protein Q4Q35_00775, partial [Flavivirga aquimarina]|nr:hypothetical protein [Flavivirga aquimarina]